MSTKSNNCLPSKDAQKACESIISNNDYQFKNLNLNQNQNSSNVHFVHSKIKSSNNSQSQSLENTNFPGTVVSNKLSVFNDFDKASQKFFNFFGRKEKTSHSISSEYLNVCEKENQSNWKKEKDKMSNNTLSLRISAYQNNVNSDNFCFKKSFMNLKHKVGDGFVTTVVEIPRQQKEEAKEPEIMQFKASQKLLDPNQSNLSQVVNKFEGCHIEELNSGHETPEQKLKNVCSQLGFCTRNNPLNYEQYGKYIEEAAKNGSVTAQKHMEIWKNLVVALEAFEKNDSGGLVCALSKAIRLHPKVVEVPKLFTQFIEERMKTHQNDVDTIVCYLRTHPKRFPQLTFDSQEKFPDDEYLAERAYDALDCTGNLEDTLSYVEAAIKRIPNNLHLLALRACKKSLTKESMEVLNAFLAAAPPDDPSVPICYYLKLECCGFMEDWKNFVESYEAFLVAERSQLPCFEAFPYIYGRRRLFERTYMLWKDKVGHRPPKSEINQRESTILSSHRLERRKTDPERKRLIIQNRQNIVDHLEGTVKPDFFSGFLFGVTHTINPPNSSPLVTITLRNMDPNEDKVYNERILEARIIDWAYFDYIIKFCVQLKIEDENLDVSRFEIYNWPSTGDRKADCRKVMKVFRPNTKILIINPYHRKPEIGQTFIRVEGLKYVKIDDSMVDKMCHVCGKESAKTLPLCSRCKLAFYCSKECQKLDWIELNHKSICKHLENIAHLM